MSQRDRLIGNNGFVHSLHFCVVKGNIRPKDPVEQLKLVFTASSINT